MFFGVLLYFYFFHFYLHHHIIENKYEKGFEMLRGRASERERERSLRGHHQYHRSEFRIQTSEHENRNSKWRAGVSSLAIIGGEVLWVPLHRVGVL